MKKKTISRLFMIASGILAAVIILFSQSYYSQSDLAAKKESDNKAKSGKVIISAPSDALINNTVVKSDQNPTTQLQTRFLTTETKSFRKVESSLFVNFFHTLFRAIISPNAP
jgi:hypothetical protein